MNNDFAEKPEMGAPPNSEGLKRRDLLLSGSSLIAVSGALSRRTDKRCASAATGNSGAYAGRTTAEHRRHHG